ncbi:MAG: Uma2 family endonuclease [Gemmataceae bacterium]|nr:Uma2 family endonuclease [Gemmataceae bacterium]
MSSTTLPAPAPAVPLLRDGEAMTRSEFKHRWDAMPDLKNAELIEGVVHMPSPTRADHHGNPHFNLITWLGFYSVSTPGTAGDDNSSIELAGDNMPQADAGLRVLRSHGGRTRITGEGYIDGGPEFVAEVAASSAFIDRGAKFRLYQANGVCEYHIWFVLQRRVEWFILQDGAYRPLPPDADGITRSRVFPGLWLDADALARMDMPRVMAVLQAGLASLEHAAFVARLAAAAQA